MNSAAVQAIVAISTFIGSIGASAFIAGMRWGSVKQEVQNVDKRLARIEGMFEMKLKD